VKTLPGVREALELRRWREAEAQVVIAAQLLEAYAARIDAATTILEPAPAELTRKPASAP